MKILFYDTETSGMPLWGEPSSDPRQPHILQVAAALVDSESGSIEQEINLLVRPDGWEIDPEAQAVHGITAARANAYGVPEPFALACLIQLWGLADLRFGHVESFDARIVRIALSRHSQPEMVEEVRDLWKSGPAACTCAMTAHLNRKLRRKGPRGPKLAEAYQHYIGQPLESAHTAQADMRACMAVYFHALADPDRPALPSDSQEPT